MSTGPGGASPRQRQLALVRANHVRAARAALKRRLRAGQLAAAEAILRCSSDTDTMIVADLLLSQRGWGPRRCSKLLRSVSVSETATLGSLTERQRVMLAAVLSSPEKKERTFAHVDSTKEVREPRSYSEEKPPDTR